MTTKEFIDIMDSGEIIPGGSPIGETEKDLRVSAPKAVFKQGKVMNNSSQEEVEEWIKTID